jgi:hypothetical protein
MNVESKCSSHPEIRGTSMSQRCFIKCRLVKVCSATVFVLALATVFPAWASLGGDAASIQADQLHMQGSRTTKAVESYTVHEIQASTGTVVREYLSPEGKVFAVAWNGPRLPDLRQLFGGYFEPYRAAVQSRSGARMVRGPVTIDQPGLAVQIGGHVGAFSGRAYVPDMLPSGVRAEDIQ